MNGLMIAAPSSGCGKTTVTLGLLRALRKRGVAVASTKAGPDYLDPAFHAFASGGSCVNLDPWPMRPGLLRQLARESTASGAMLVVEGMMGLFDGAADGSGSAADLASLLELPVILVVDCAKQSQSVAALVRGFRDHRSDMRIAGVVLNRVGSGRHEAMLRQALGAVGAEVLGVIPRDERLALPERHLGLVQAGEHRDIEGFVEQAAEIVAVGVDLVALQGIAGLEHQSNFPSIRVPRLPPFGQRIAIARDEAFAFAYPHVLDGWRDMGAEISFFSPLADEAPDAAADAVYLPGGYPELNAGRLAVADRFRRGMTEAAARGAAIYGECGGYMVLGEGLTDAAGSRHAMLGLLPLETSFAERRLHLGYRRLQPLAGAPWSTGLVAHEFHYARIVREGQAPRLFAARDAVDEDLGPAGLRVRSVCGAFMHVIDLSEEGR